MNKLLQNIPQSRLLLYLIVLGFIPILAVGMLLFGRLETIDTMENSLQLLQTRVLQKERKQSANQSLANYYRKADHFYIDKNLEKLNLLADEIEALKKVAENPNFADNEMLRRRLEFLNSSQNKISFTESGVQSTPQFQEVIEALAHPVEVDQKDIRKILSLIEGMEADDLKIPEDKPQLVLLEFKLDKKSNNDKNEVFVLNMKLLKREFQ